MKALLIRLRDILTRPATIQKAIRCLKPPSAVRSRLRPVGEHVIHLPTGDSFTYVAHSDDVLARGLIWDDWATWERATADFLIERLSSARCFWDIGAYAGIYSLLACATNRDLEVVAFEPVPEHLEWLRTNIDTNGWSHRVEIEPFAVSDRRSDVEMVLVVDDRTASGIGVDRSGTTLIVPSIQLSDVDSIPDVIKIDIEGHEVAALSTVRELLRSHKPVIVTECLTTIAVREMIDFLEPLGYELHHLSTDGLIRADREFVVPSRQANFAAIAKDGQL